MRHDNQCLEDIQGRLVERGIPPGKQYVDQAYMSGYHIAESQDKGIDLRGYVREGNTSKPEGFRLRDFQIDVEHRQAICPAGKKQVKWAKAKPGVKNLIAYHVGFGMQCQSCPYFGPDLCFGASKSAMPFQSDSGDLRFPTESDMYTLSRRRMVRNFRGSVV